MLLFFRAWGKSAVLDRRLLHKRTRTFILSLALSLTFFRYLSRFERWRETAEREREREREELLFTRAKAHSFSLSFSSVRDFSRLSVFPNGELEEKTRG